MLGQGLVTYVTNVYQLICTKMNNTEPTIDKKKVQEQFLTHVREGEFLTKVLGEEKMEKVGTALARLVAFANDIKQSDKLDDVATALPTLVASCVEAMMQLGSSTTRGCEWTALRSGISALSSRKPIEKLQKESDIRLRAINEDRVTHDVLDTLGVLVKDGVEPDDVALKALKECDDMISNFKEKQVQSTKRLIQGLGTRLTEALKLLCRCLQYIGGRTFKKVETDDRVNRLETTKHIDFEAAILYLTGSSFACSYEENGMRKTKEWKQFTNCVEEALNFFDEKMRQGDWADWRDKLYRRRIGLSMELMPQYCRFWASEMERKIESSISLTLFQLARIYFEKQGGKFKKEEISNVVNSLLNDSKPEPGSLSDAAKGVQGELLKLMKKPLRGFHPKVVQATGHAALLIPLHVTLLAEVERLDNERQESNKTLRERHEPTLPQLRLGEVLTHANTSSCPITFSKNDVIVRAFKPFLQPRVRMSSEEKKRLSERKELWKKRVAELRDDLKREDLEGLMNQFSESLVNQLGENDTPLTKLFDLLKQRRRSPLRLFVYQEENRRGVKKLNANAIRSDGLSFQFLFEYETRDAKMPVATTVPQDTPSPPLSCAGIDPGSVAVVTAAYDVGNALGDLATLVLAMKQRQQEMKTQISQVAQNLRLKLSFEHGTALKALKRKRDFFIHYLNNLQATPEHVKHDFGTHYAEFLEENKTVEQLQALIATLNIAWKEGRDYERKDFDGFVVPRAEEPVFELACKLHRMARDHARHFEEESKNPRTETKSLDEKRSLEALRSSPKKEIPFVDTHAFVTVSRGQWAEWRGIEQIETARRRYDENFWQGRGLPQQYFEGKSKLPSWPSFKTCDPNAFGAALVKEARLRREQLHNSDRTLKQLKVWKRRFEVTAKQRILDAITFGDKKTKLFYGNGEWSQAHRGWLPAPGKGLREWISKHHSNIRLINEEYTSLVAFSSLTIEIPS